VLTVLFGASECPVCGDSGSLICLKPKNQVAPTLVFYCPLCCTAFRNLPPEPFAVEEVLALEELAPFGVELPTREEVIASGVELEKLSDEWVEWLTATDPRRPHIPPVIGEVVR